MTIIDLLGNVPEGLGIKTPCTVATTGNIVLSGLQTIDGVAVVANQRVLVWQQTDQTTNGIYQASTGNWTRPNDANNNESFIKGTEVIVVSGSTYGNEQFIVTCADDPVIIGTSLLTWQVLSATIAPGQITYAKMQSATAARLLGNPTNATASLSEISLGATFAFSGSSLRTVSMTGDVTTVSNSFATTIAAAAVTYAKIQNVAASRLLGNPTGGAASPSEITLGTTFLFSGSAIQTASGTGDVTWASNSFATTIANAAVTLAKMSSLAASSIIGNNTGSAATPVALSSTQLTAMVNNFTSNLSGAVPLSGGGTANFLRADGTFAAPGGSGTVTTSGSPSNGQLAQFAGSTVIQGLAAGQIPGTATNDSASTGNVGEFQQSIIAVGSAVAASASGAGNVYSVTSKSLTAGDWEISGIVVFDTPNSSTYAATRAGIGTTSNTMPAFGAGANSIVQTATNPPDFGVVINPQRFSFASTTTVFLLASATFTGSSPTAYGEINCWRVR